MSISTGTCKLFLAGVVALSASAGCREKSSTPRVIINGETWYVDLATTPDERARGLSGRARLSEDVGMLFIYPSPRVLEFCMRGCLVPLDIAFIDADFRIVKIHTMQVEPDLAGHATRMRRVSYSSVRPARYALEVAGGSLRRAGVRVGDKAIFFGDIPEAAKAAPGL